MNEKTEEEEKQELIKRLLENVEECKRLQAEYEEMKKLNPGLRIEFFEDYFKRN